MWLMRDVVFKGIVEYTISAQISWNLVNYFSVTESFWNTAELYKNDWTTETDVMDERGIWV